MSALAKQLIGEEKPQQCRIRGCSGKVAPHDTPDMRGLCKDHQHNQAERWRQNGEHSRAIAGIWKGHERGRKEWQDAVGRMPNKGPF